MFMFDFSTFQGGLGKSSKKSESRKIAAGKIVFWEGSISVGPGLDAHGERGRAPSCPNGGGTSVAMIERVYGHFRNQSYQEAQARLDGQRATRGL